MEQSCWYTARGWMLQIQRLVYVAAYLPQSGESLYGLSQQDKDSLVGKYWRQDDAAHYSPPYIDQEAIREVFAADAPREDVDRLIANHKAAALAPMATPVSFTPENFGKVKKVYIHSTLLWYGKKQMFLNLVSPALTNKIITRKMV